MFEKIEKITYMRERNAFFHIKQDLHFHKNRDLGYRLNDQKIFRSYNKKKDFSFLQKNTRMPTNAY